MTFVWVEKPYLRYSEEDGQEASSACQGPWEAAMGQEAQPQPSGVGAHFTSLGYSICLQPCSKSCWRQLEPVTIAQVRKG